VEEMMEEGEEDGEAVVAVLYKQYIYIYIYYIL